MYRRETLELHGAYPDLIPQDAPLVGWNSANNVFFQNGETRRVGGDTPVFSPPSDLPRAMVFYINASGEPHWVYATEAGIFAVDVAGETEITPTTATWAPSTDSVTTAITYNGMVVINDSKSGPFYWNGNIGSECERLPGWPVGWRCVSMRSHKAFLFAIGRTDTGGMQRVNWSDAAEAGTMPQDWMPSASNLAGFVDLLPAASMCVDGFSLRDDMLVFKGESIHAFSFVGGNDVFAVRKRFSQVGLAGVDGWCRGHNDEALFMGSDGDIYKTDGVNYGSVLDGVAQQTYYDDSDPLQFRTVACATLYRSGLSILGYPTQGNGEVNRAIIYEWATGDIGFRDMPQIGCMAEGRYLQNTSSNLWDQDPDTWSSDTTPWDQSLAPSTADDVVAGGLANFWWLTGENAATVPLPAYVYKEGLSFGDAGRRKQIGRVWPKLVGEDGDTVTIRIGGQEHTGGPVAWSPTVDYMIGTTEHIDAFAQGRFMALEISAQAGKPWKLGTVDVEFRGAGRW